MSCGLPVFRCSFCVSLSPRLFSSCIELPLPASTCIQRELPPSTYLDDRLIHAVGACDGWSSCVAVVVTSRLSCMHPRWRPWLISHQPRIGSVLLYSAPFCVDTMLAAMR